MNAFKDTIREKGLRVTPARVAVLRILLENEKPLDISDIISQISKQRVDADQATIYRIVENFVEKNLIDRLQFQKQKYYYEAKRAEHHHAVCSNCGKIQDVTRCNIKRLENEITKKMNFEVTSHALEFYGICSECLK